MKGTQEIRTLSLGDPQFQKVVHAEVMTGEGLRSEWDGVSLEFVKTTIKEKGGIAD